MVSKPKVNGLNPAVITWSYAIVILKKALYLHFLSPPTCNRYKLTLRFYRRWAGVPSRGSQCLSSYIHELSCKFIISNVSKMFWDWNQFQCFGIENSFKSTFCIFKDYTFYTASNNMLLHRNSFFKIKKMHE